MRPSDPRPGMLPRGRAGWAVCGGQEPEALLDLTFGTGPL
jgi:hypothetical protein